MIQRICLGCGEPYPARGRCSSCEQAKRLARSRARERTRPSRYDRGYGASHYAVRRALAATLPRFCGYGCGTWLTVDSQWNAAHLVDGDPTQGYLVACPTCNQRAKVRSSLTSHNHSISTLYQS